MKAAVIYHAGEMPQYVEQYPEPEVRERNELVISVKASAVKHLDKSRADGRHYSAADNLSEAKIPGGDGVGVLKNGIRVFAFGDSMMAEKAVVEKDRIIKLPKGIDDATAAALPNAVIGSAAALLFRARMKRGETILINGATSFTGKIAIQVAKYYGAKKIFVTGRNEETLRSLTVLGASKIISLNQSDENIAAQLKELHRHEPIDIIIDYLWGRSAEIILSSLMGNGTFTHKTRYVSIGSITGDKIALSAEVLRSVDLHISGSGLGSWTRNEIRQLLRNIVPKMLKLAAAGKLKIDIMTIYLKDIEKLWDLDTADGKRLVVLI